MSRPRKCRRVCGLPQNESFIPAAPHGHKEPVILSIDEYEAIRLIDRQNLSQEECGEYMQVARTTVQQIYSKQEKIANALVEGRALHQGRRLPPLRGQLKSLRPRRLQASSTRTHVRKE